MRKHLQWSLIFSEIVGPGLKIYLKRPPMQLYFYQFHNIFRRNIFLEQLQTVASTCIICFFHLLLPCRIEHVTIIQAKYHK